MRAGLVACLCAALVLAGCTAEPVRVGSKAFAENRILAEMLAILMEEEGIAIERRMALGATPAVFEALKEGTIDVYPEYTGTGLALIGAPQTGDRALAFEVVSESFAELGMRFLDRLGFETGYAVVTRPRLARDLDLSQIADLSGVDEGLRLGVTSAFADRPRDGLEPFLDRFGLAFERVELFADAPRNDLYDALVEERVDVIVGFTTDPEIADYGLRRLADEEGFFPAYEAAPLVSAEALERQPAVADALSRLAGRIDAPTMRALKAAVRLDGRPARLVARRALYDLGLVDEPPRDIVPSLAVAVEPETVGTSPASRTLRAVRRAMRGRDVDLLASPAPLSSVAAREARMALVPAIATFTVDGTSVARDERFEAVAAVASSFVHALARGGETIPADFSGAIATGPEGSPSHRLATVMAASREPPATVVPLAAADAQTAAEALHEGRADVAVVLAVPGRQDLRTALARGAVDLVSASPWWEGAVRLALPFLREARIAADIYPGMERAVQTLAMQLVLVGPAPPERFVIGQQGPSTFSDDILPIADDKVRTINANLGRHPAIDPHLRRAQALAPTVRVADERITPRPEQAVLTLVILVFFAWAAWLLFRPKGESGS